MTRFFRRQLYVRRLTRGRLKAFKVMWEATDMTGCRIRCTTVEYAGSWKAVQRWHRKEPPSDMGRFTHISAIRRRP